MSSSCTDPYPTRHKARKVANALNQALYEPRDYLPVYKDVANGQASPPYTLNPTAGDARLPVNTDDKDHSEAPPYVKHNGAAVMAVG